MRKSDARKLKVGDRVRFWSGTRWRIHKVVSVDYPACFLCHPGGDLQLDLASKVDLADLETINPS